MENTCFKKIIMLVLVSAIFTMPTVIAFGKSDARKPTFRFSVEKCSNDLKGPTAIDEIKWIDDETLEVSANILVTCCCESITGVDYKLSGGKLSLLYSTGRDGLCCDCMCSQRLVYYFSNLAKKEYGIKLLSMQGGEVSYGTDVAPARLRISSDPSGAEVFINAEYRGTTPITISDLKPGMVNVEVRKEGKSRYSKKIELKPGEIKNVGTIKLGEFYGSVTVQTIPPGASVIFDGEGVGARTPATIKKIKRDRQHTVKLVLEGYKPWEKSFDMSDTDDKTFDVILEKQVGDK